MDTGILDYPRPCNCEDIFNCEHCYVNEYMTILLKEACFHNWDNFRFHNCMNLYTNDGKKLIFLSK